MQMLLHLLAVCCLVVSDIHMNKLSVVVLMVNVCSCAVGHTGGMPVGSCAYSWWSMNLWGACR